MVLNWNDIWLYLFGFVGVIYTLTIIFTLIVVILENRSPQKTISWILVLILLPVIGLLSYLVFGQNYRKQKMFSLKGLGDLKWLQILSQDQKGKLEKNKFLRSERIHEKKNVMTLLLNNSKAILTKQSGKSYYCLHKIHWTFPKRSICVTSQFLLSRILICREEISGIWGILQLCYKSRAQWIYRTSIVSISPGIFRSK